MVLLSVDAVEFLRELGRENSRRLDHHPLGSVHLDSLTSSSRTGSPDANFRFFLTF